MKELEPEQAQLPNEMAVAVIIAAIFTKAKRKRNSKKSGGEKKSQ